MNKKEITFQSINVSDFYQGLPAGRQGEVMLKFRATAKFDKEASIILIDQKQLATKKFVVRDKLIQEEILENKQVGLFTGKVHQILPITYKKKVILLLGVGKENELSLTALRIALRKAIISSFLGDKKEIEIIPHRDDEGTLKAIVEACLIGTYSWRKYKSSNKKQKISAKRCFYVVSNKTTSLDDTVRICEGVNLTRDLINDNADTVTSAFLEKIIRGLIKGKKNITLEILNRKEMKTKGLNLHLAVNQGSQNEPKLIIVKYAGTKNHQEYTAIIGKGMTFDTGGLNIKPSGHIETMRQDMSGAAAIIGTLKNIIAINPLRNIIFVVVLAENVTGAASYKPGDVIKSYSGKTVEVANTDAEGRLVLADAIAYIAKNYKPKRIIDIATLTGSCVVALGHDYSGLVSNDDKIAKHLMDLSVDTDDRVWRLPSYPELKDSVKSHIADIRNLGFSKGAAGTITAAEFLRQFTNDISWAHLDIAGTAFNEGTERSYYGHGATGAGVRLLTNYLIKH